MRVIVSRFCGLGFASGRCDHDDAGAGEVSKPITNVAFGPVVLAAGIWVAGYNLNAASEFLATLAKFEDERS
jgi:hypothetical protein